MEPNIQEETLQKNTIEKIKLLAMLLADNIYHDQSSGKFVVAGIFHQINANDVPFVFNRTPGIFISLAGLKGKHNVTFEFSEKESKKVLLKSDSLEINFFEDNIPFDFALELPYFTIYIYRETRIKAYNS